LNQAPGRGERPSSGAGLTETGAQTVRRSETLSVSIPTTFERAWDFLSGPENLHLWTVDFASERPRKVGDAYRVETPRGPLDLFVRCDRATGVIDFHFGRDGRFGCSPSRLLADGDGVVYVFTQFEPEGAPPDLFEQLVANVREELRILRELLGTPA
jgi:hypothetical protein